MMCQVLKVNRMSSGNSFSRRSFSFFFKLLLSSWRLELELGLELGLKLELELELDSSATAILIVEGDLFAYKSDS